MPKLKLYALMLIAKGPPSEIPRVIAAKPTACVARDLGRALSKGWAAAKEAFPAGRGWFETDARATEISAEMIRAVCSQEVTNE